MQHSSPTVMTERTLSLLYTIPQADEVTMRKEYFSHLYLICGCYSTNGRQEQRSPLHVTRFQSALGERAERAGREEARPPHPSGERLPVACCSRGEPPCTFPALPPPH